eukprot:scaffold202456_cov28-Tisochrysis_lutea.AAC.4
MAARSASRTRMRSSKRAHSPSRLTAKRIHRKCRKPRREKRETPAAALIALIYLAVRCCESAWVPKE